MKYSNDIVKTLKKHILVEFSELARLYSEHKIYGCALCIDSDFLTSYLVFSSEETITNVNQKWDADEWVLGVENEELIQGLNDFSDKMIQYFNDDIIPNIKNIDEDAEKKNNYDIYHDGFKLAIIDIKNRYVEYEDLVFFINANDDKNIALSTAKEFSLDTNILKDFLLHVNV